MANPDDGQFEAYLKEFRPLPAAPLPLNVPAATARKPRHLGITVWALTATAIVILVLLRIPAQHVTGQLGQNPTAALRADSTQPLTLRSANELLVNSPSFKAALDSVEFYSAATVPIPKGKESALVVLSQEDVKP